MKNVRFVGNVKSPVVLVPAIRMSSIWCFAMRTKQWLARRERRLGPGQRAAARNKVLRLSELALDSLSFSQELPDQSIDYKLHEDHSPKTGHFLLAYMYATLSETCVMGSGVIDLRAPPPSDTPFCCRRHVSRKTACAEETRTALQDQGLTISSPSSSSALEASPGTSPHSIGESSSSQMLSDVGQDLQLVVIPPYTTPPDQATFQAFMWNLENAVPPTLTMPPEFEAVPFFFKNFVSLPQQADSMRGYLELLVPLYNEARPSSTLHLATNAVSLACFGNYPGRQDQLREAVQTYGKALRQLNEDLKDPILSKSDETILAILLFSLYEVSAMITSAKFSVVFLLSVRSCHSNTHN